jgi:hypothetical protein
MTPTEAATLHTVRSTAAINSTATHVSAETSIQSATSTSAWNAPPTPRNRLAKRSGPDWTIEVGIEQRHLDTHTVAPATDVAADHHNRIFASLMSSNDERELR